MEMRRGRIWKVERRTNNNVGGREGERPGDNGDQNRFGWNRWNMGTENVSGERNSGNREKHIWRYWAIHKKIVFDGMSIRIIRSLFHSISIILSSYAKDRKEAGGMNDCDK